MANNPQVALVFFWRAVERQVRVEGIVEKVTEAESDEYFATRPANSRTWRWASEQSELLSSRDELDARHRELLAQFPNGSIPGLRTGVAIA